MEARVAPLILRLQAASNAVPFDEDVFDRCLQDIASTCGKALEGVKNDLRFGSQQQLQEPTLSIESIRACQDDVWTAIFPYFCLHMTAGNIMDALKLTLLKGTDNTYLSPETRRRAVLDTVRAALTREPFDAQLLYETTHHLEDYPINPTWVDFIEEFEEPMLRRLVECAGDAFASSAMGRAIASTFWRFVCTPDPNPTGDAPNKYTHYRLTIHALIERIIPRIATLAAADASLALAGMRVARHVVEKCAKVCEPRGGPATTKCEPFEYPPVFTRTLFDLLYAGVDALMLAADTRELDDVSSHLEKIPADILKLYLLLADD